MRPSHLHRPAIVTLVTMVAVACLLLAGWAVHPGHGPLALHNGAGEVLGPAAGASCHPELPRHVESAAPEHGDCAGCLHRLQHRGGDLSIPRVAAPSAAVVALPAPLRCAPPSPALFAGGSRAPPLS